MINPFWYTWVYVKYWKNRHVPEQYYAYLRQCSAAPETAYWQQNSARAEAYPEGPDGGWRYDFCKLPQHDKLLANYHLDDVAGQGTTLERALRVMNWLCEHTWYNGMEMRAWLRFQGRREDSLRVLRYAYDGGFGHAINCRHKALLLADCLLAAGIFATPIGMINYTFAPGETPVKPQPNHFTVHVWLPEQRRWVMLDPSFNSYITDSTGQPLHLIEIHERHRAGLPLEIAQYALNGTQECREGYLNGFVLGSLLELMVSGGTGQCLDGTNRLLPEDVPRKQGKELRYISTVELLAEPTIKGDV